jgi:hypothetical protein
VELGERALGDRLTLAAKVADPDPWCRVATGHRPQVVELVLLAERPLQPMQRALRLDHRPGPLHVGLRHRSLAESAER